jgi:nucleoside-diphosphate-sugar epimerase
VSSTGHADLPIGALEPGVHRSDSRVATPALVEQLQQAGWTVRVVDLGSASGKAAILERFARSLAFPEWVGHNWDALDDALRDLSWWTASERGRVIVLRSSSQATTEAGRDDAMLYDVLETAAIRWAATDTPLVVLIRR